MAMMLAAQGLGLAGRLYDVSLVLRPGEMTAICGPNGAGKSSLLAALAGLLAPQAGLVLAGGVDLAAMEPRARARAIGYLPQAGEAAWDISVERLVGLGRLPWQGAPMHRARASAGQDAEAVEQAIAAMDLGGLRARALSRLSGGERARAMLARVLAGGPRWILADEPLASLDLAHGLRLLRALRAQAQSGVGVALVVHDLAVAMNHADRVVVIDHGAVVADGAPGDALAEAVIGDVWGVRGRWLGEPGARALAVNHRPG